MDGDLLDQACAFIQGFEGLRLTSYQDVTGVWTVGYGATGSNIGPNTVWTEVQATQDLQSRVQSLYTRMAQIVNVQLNDNEWIACIDFAYNCGFGAFSQSHLLRSINNGVTDPPTITSNFESWDHTGDTVNSDLLARRKAEANLFCSEN